MNITRDRKSSVDSKDNSKGDPKNSVTRHAAASSADALRHFTNRLQFETDCWDVHDALSRDVQDFVLVDVRGIGGYAAGHVPGAIHLPRTELTEERLAEYPADTLFVVYCAGPHCNGANKAAIRLAELGRPVKEMIGGVCGWRDEGFELVKPKQIAAAG